MFRLFQKSPIYDSEFEQILTYDIGGPTNEDLEKRVQECLLDMAKRDLNGFSPRGHLEKDIAGSNYLYLKRVIYLRQILERHGWRKI